VSFRDDFEGHDLDRSVWIPHYLPQWSSRAESAATYEVTGSELRLSIPTGQGLWCPVEHEGPLRVSGIQSGVFSGAVGSTAGQQPFRDGLRVREAQPAQWGWTPRYGVLEVRAQMELTARSMASVWMVGIEDEPQRSGEICVFEVFGDAIGRAGPAVGMGIHPFRDPALRGVATRVSGPCLAVDALAGGRPVWERRRLGSQASVVMVGPLSPDDRAQARSSGLDLTPLSLQQIVVQAAAGVLAPASETCFETERTCA
jgi:hypothetical protein